MEGMEGTAILWILTFSVACWISYTGRLTAPRIRAFLLSRSVRGGLDFVNGAKLDDFCLFVEHTVFQQSAKNYMKQSRQER